MKAAKAKKRTPIVNTPDDVRKFLRRLNGVADVEAQRILFEYGVAVPFQGESYHILELAVDRIAGPKTTDARSNEIHAAAAATGDFGQAFTDMSNLLSDQKNAIMDAAYVLGVAVGRRMGGVR